jgi:hypothetical protein
MSIRPIDMKTTLMANNNASKIRETQKVREEGLAENVKQHKDESEHQSQSVQKTDPTEDKVIRKEDEEEEKKGKNRQGKENTEDEDVEEENTEQETHEAAKQEQAKKTHPKIPDGLRGIQIDIKI